MLPTATIAIKRVMPAVRKAGVYAHIVEGHVTAAILGDSARTSVSDSLSVTAASAVAASRLVELTLVMAHISVAAFRRVLAATLKCETLMQLTVLGGMTLSFLQEFEDYLRRERVRGGVKTVPIAVTFRPSVALPTAWVRLLTNAGGVRLSMSPAPAKLPAVSGSGRANAHATSRDASASNHKAHAPPMPASKLPAVGMTGGFLRVDGCAFADCPANPTPTAAARRKGTSSVWKEPTTPQLVSDSVSVSPGADESPPPAPRGTAGTQPPTARVLFEDTPVTNQVPKPPSGVAPAAKRPQPPGLLAVINEADAFQRQLDGLRCRVRDVDGAFAAMLVALRAVGAE